MMGVGFEFEDSVKLVNGFVEGVVLYFVEV